MNKINSACEYLANVHNAEFASTYGEPGYTNPEKGIIFANWNNIPEGLAKWLEKCGFETEWSDEWAVVNDKAYRTSPDSYSWECQLMLTNDGEWLTPDDGADSWIDECAATDKGQPVKCLPSWVDTEDLESAGFTLHAPGLESGWFPGQTDNPAEIAAAAFNAGAVRLVFRKTENSQFYCKFECWVEMPYTPMAAEFDRFDICGAHLALENDNQRAIYCNALHAFGLTLDPRDDTHARIFEFIRGQK